MKRKILWGTIVLLAGAQAGVQPRCSGCSIGKEKLQCDYYVERKADRAHQKECLTYAKYVDIDGAYPKAAWYYLLAGAFPRAEASARKALKQGQAYGGEYLAVALWAQGKRAEAKKAMKRFLRDVPQHEYLKKDLESLKRLYPKMGIEALLRN